MMSLRTVTSIIITIKINLYPFHYFLLLVGKVCKTVNNESMESYAGILRTDSVIDIVKFLCYDIVEEVCKIIFLASIDFESPYLLVHMSTVSAGNHSESRISFNSIS